MVAEPTRAQFAAVKNWSSATEVGEVVCATDAGREGELIFRYILEAAGCRKPVRRLWIPSLTPEAIRRGFAALRPLSEFDPLADSAHARARADWLVGMNLSRAATLAHGELFSVGRVQTPTLALLVEREKAIRAFVPEDYLEVVATFAPDWGGPPLPRDVVPRREAHPGGPPASEGRRRGEGHRRASAGGRAEVESVDAETRRLPPPLLYDLTELQRHANRVHGLSAKETLAAAQSLYETRKLLTYPRTDSRHLSRDVAATLPAVVAAVAKPLRRAPRPRDRRAAARPAVRGRLPGDRPPRDPPHRGERGGPRPDARRAPRPRPRLPSPAHGVARRARLRGDDRHHAGRGRHRARAADRFHSSGTAVLQAGWKVLDLAPPPARPGREPRGKAARPSRTSRPASPRASRSASPGSRRSTRRPGRHAASPTRRSSPRWRRPGPALDDRELSEAMKERGLGTPATRAETIETLLRRGYAERQGKALAATDTGIRLVDLVHPQVKSAALTGEWEAQLARIRQKEVRLPEFMERIEAFVRDLVGQTLGDPVTAPSLGPPSERGPRDICARRPRAVASEEPQTPGKPGRKAGSLRSSPGGRREALRRAPRARTGGAPRGDLAPSSTSGSACRRSARIRRRSAARWPRARTCCS